MVDLLNTIITGPAKKVGSILVRAVSTDKQSTEAYSTDAKVLKEQLKQAENALKKSTAPFGYHSLPNASRGFLKLAAVSGLAAVVMSAYGSHGNF